MDALTARKRHIDTVARHQVLRGIRDALAGAAQRNVVGWTVQNNIEDASEFNISVPGRFGGTFKVKITRFRGS